MNKPKKPVVCKPKKGPMGPKAPKQPMPGQAPTKAKKLPPWMK